MSVSRKQLTSQPEPPDPSRNRNKPFDPLPLVTHFGLTVRPISLACPRAALPVYSQSSLKLLPCLLRSASIIHIHPNFDLSFLNSFFIQLSSLRYPLQKLTTMTISLFASPLFLFTAITTILYILYRTITTSLARRRFARKNGCLPAAHLPLRDPILGIDGLRASISAAKQRKLLSMLTDRFYSIAPTYTSLRLGSPAIITMEPENVKAILATRFKDFAIAPFRQPALHPFLGDGIFTTDGPHWAASRAMIRPNFSRDQVADLDAFEDHFRDLLKAMPDGFGAEGEEGFDLQELFFRFTIDSATEFLFGKSVRSLSAEGADEAEARFAEAFTVAQAEGLDLIRLGPLARLLGAKRRLSTGERAVDVVHAYVDQFVDEAVRYREGLEMGEKSEEGEEGKKYVFLHELAKQTKDKRRLRDELLNVLLAGRDTTASLLGNLFWVLSKRPDVWAKLREEIEQQLGGKTPTYEELRNMKYLKWCLNECKFFLHGIHQSICFSSSPRSDFLHYPYIAPSRRFKIMEPTNHNLLHIALRLHPVVPLNSRMCVADTVFPVGGGPDGKAPVFVKKGTVASYSVFAMHRRKDIYGPDADEFRPERWESLRVGWEYLPFNGGPRICVGQQYALTEASYVTVRLAQEFKTLRSTDPSDVWQEQIALTLCSGNGCRVALTPA